MSTWTRNQKLTLLAFIGASILTITFGLASVFSKEFRQSIGIEPIQIQLCDRAYCKQKFAKLILKAQRNLVGIPSEQEVKFPIGVNSPISLRERPSAVGELQVIGSINKQGKVEPIKLSNIREIFEHHLNFLNSLDLSSNNKQKNIQFLQVSYFSNSSIYTARLDLIVVNPSTKVVYFLPNVLYSSVLKDALNAALNKEVIPNTTIKVENLDLKAIQNLP